MPRTEAHFNKIIRKTAWRHLRKVHRLLDLGHEGWIRVQDEPLPVRRAYEAYRNIQFIHEDEKLLSYAR
jgi:hypothetical protein